MRIFVLTSEPRLKYYKNEMDFRGEIPLTKDVSAELQKDGTFKLQTPRKVYLMKETSPGDASEWVQSINKAVELYSQNLKVWFNHFKTLTWVNGQKVEKNISYIFVQRFYTFNHAYHKLY